MTRVMTSRTEAMHAWLRAGILAGRLAHFKIPRVWRFVAALPMTAAGKIRRTEVKQEMNTPVDIKEADRRDAR